MCTPLRAHAQMGTRMAVVLVPTCIHKWAMCTCSSAGTSASAHAETGLLVPVGRCKWGVCTLASHSSGQVAMAWYRAMPHRWGTPALSDQMDVHLILFLFEKVCKQIWLGLFDDRSSAIPDFRDPQKVKEFLQEKYEKKRWLVQMLL